MESLRRQLRGARWGLPLARVIAGEVGGSRAAVRALVRELFGEDVEVRKRAADVARRGTEVGGGLLGRDAGGLGGVVEALAGGGSGTRWRLGLGVPWGAEIRV